MLVEITMREVALVITPGAVAGLLGSGRATWTAVACLVIGMQGRSYRLLVDAVNP